MQVEEEKESMPFLMISSSSEAGGENIKIKKNHMLKRNHRGRLFYIFHSVNKSHEKAQKNNVSVITILSPSPVTLSPKLRMIYVY